MVFHKCSINDLSLLKDISERTYLETFAEHNTQECMEAYLQTAFNEEKLANEINNPGSVFYIAYHDGVPAGYLKLNEPEAQTDVNDIESIELERFYLLADYHGKGFGKQLFQKALDFAVQKKKSYLWLGVWERNYRAIAFYTKMGLYRTGEHVFVMGDEDQIDNIMRLDLGGAGA